MHPAPPQSPAFFLAPCLYQAYRNTVTIPRHWSQKRKYLQGKRGLEKPPFKLPEFIEATGIGAERGNEGGSALKVLEGSWLREVAVMRVPLAVGLPARLWSAHNRGRRQANASSTMPDDNSVCGQPARSCFGFGSSLAAWAACRRACHPRRLRCGPVACLLCDSAAGEMRQAYLEKADGQKMKQKAKERMQPKMGKLDIDYQVRLGQQGWVWWSGVG
jgi:hypothetical protein